MQNSYEISLSVGRCSQLVRVCDTEEEADLVKAVVCRVLDILETTKLCVEWRWMNSDE